MMPISATGADPTPNLSPRRDGFTLVELMVVLVIIGLATAAVVVTIPAGQTRLADDADAFAAKLVTARDLSVITGRDIAVTVDANGYAFAQRDGADWRATTARPLQAKPWPAGTAAQTRMESGDRLVFDSTGLATPALITLQQGSSRASVVVDAAGNVHVEAR
jgi:general secretion pathway protein H